MKPDNEALEFIVASLNATGQFQDIQVQPSIQTLLNQVRCSGNTPVREESEFQTFVRPPVRVISGLMFPELTAEKPFPFHIYLHPATRNIAARYNEERKTRIANKNGIYSLSLFMKGNHSPFFRNENQFITSSSAPTHRIRGNTLSREETERLVRLRQIELHHKIVTGGYVHYLDMEEESLQTFFMERIVRDYRKKESPSEHLLNASHEPKILTHLPSEIQKTSNMNVYPFTRQYDTQPTRPRHNLMPIDITEPPQEILDHYRNSLNELSRKAFRKNDIDLWVSYEERLSQMED